MIRWLLPLALWAQTAAALDVAYRAALEVKPFSIFQTPIVDGKGASLGMELGPLGDTFLTAFAERAYADAVIVDRQNSVESTAFGLGLRIYSYYRTDSMYFGTDLRQITVHFAEGGIRSEPWLKERSRLARMEVGYRWIWESGMMIRLGMDLSRQFESITDQSKERTETLALDSTTAVPDALSDIRYRVRPWILGADLGLGIVF